MKFLTWYIGPNSEVAFLELISPLPGGVGAKYDILRKEA